MLILKKGMKSEVKHSAQGVKEKMISTDQSISLLGDMK